MITACIEALMLYYNILMKYILLWISDHFLNWSSCFPENEIYNFDWKGEGVTYRSPKVEFSYSYLCHYLSYVPVNIAWFLVQVKTLVILSMEGLTKMGCLSCVW